METKICKVCKEEKPISNFGRSLVKEKIYYYKVCKHCNEKKYRCNEEYRIKRRMYQNSPKRRERKSIIMKVKNAIKSGRLIKLSCKICGEKKSFAHHFDYSKPLDVIWLCREHHDDIHFRKLRDNFGNLLPTKLNGVWCNANTPQEQRDNGSTPLTPVTFNNYFMYSQVY